MTTTHRFKHIICLVSLAFGSAAGVGLLAAGSATADPALAAPPAQAGALDGYTTSDGIEHVDYIGTDRNVHELYHTATRWYTVNLNAATGAPPAQAGALDGYTTSDGIEHVDYIGTDGDVHELYHTATRWYTVNLNVAAG